MYYTPVGLNIELNSLIKSDGAIGTNTDTHQALGTLGCIDLRRTFYFFLCERLGRALGGGWATMVLRAFIRIYFNFHRKKIIPQKRW